MLIVRGKSCTFVDEDRSRGIRTSNASAMCIGIIIKLIINFAQIGFPYRTNVCYN
ncbi:hypothetical protein SPSIL_045030 [Sporomusa silvacetica DSM 10669]|uniref:Uncharacterized protein n=1 Tax=Sporomusa silvacetica DSM 10669 TaxID=1123289 RepID=A0ABZ3IS65_9FIRM|nr:hypothetical protein SPSIL_16320 [Sporomusa silvacetica DSM 10669]